VSVVRRVRLSEVCTLKSSENVPVSRKTSAIREVSVIGRIHRTYNTTCTRVWSVRARQRTWFVLVRTWNRRWRRTTPRRSWNELVSILIDRKSTMWYTQFDNSTDNGFCTEREEGGGDTSVRHVVRGTPHVLVFALWRSSRNVVHSILRWTTIFVYMMKNLSWKTTKNYSVFVVIKTENSRVNFRVVCRISVYATNVFGFVCVLFRDEKERSFYGISTIKKKYYKKNRKTRHF